MRIRSLAALGSAALLVAGAGPAQASDLSASTVATIYPLMVTKADATEIGVTGPRMSTFGVTTSDKGTPDAPWLCDLSAENEVEGKGAPALVTKEIMSLKTGDLTGLSQELHVYASEARAKAAYRGIMKKIAKCEGQQKSTPDSDDADPGPFATTLTNGTKKSADGDAFLWVKADTTNPGPGGFVDHSYMTVRHFGKYIQIVQIESEGTRGQALTAKQVSAADAMTDTLGDRLASALQ
jgi:hypothetical protein